MAFADCVHNGPVVLLRIGVGNQEIVGLPFDAQHGAHRRPNVVHQAQCAGAFGGDFVDESGRTASDEDAIVGGDVLLGGDGN